MLPFCAAFQVFLIFLSILTPCVIALFTPFVLTGLFCDSDMTPMFPSAMTRVMRAQRDKNKSW